MSENLSVTNSVFGVYIILILGAGFLGAFLQWRSYRNGKANKLSLVQEHFMAGTGLGFVAWFFSMAASLFSGYSVNGICDEAYNNGWTASRWIPGGVGVYVGFMLLGPRCYALGKARGYMTPSELIFDRFLPPFGSHVWVAHALRILSFACLQLPVFTYLITQFQSVGVQVELFTAGGIDSLTAVLVSAAVLLVCDLLGGMRAVAFTDVLQGAVLFIGSIIFLIIQRTELGGLPEAFNYWSDPANLGKPRVSGMQLLPNKVQTVNYFDFVFKTAVAATMYPHLVQRLFCAKNASTMRRGLAAMNFTFFVVQLSSMITGWVAISTLRGSSATTAFAPALRLIANEGTGQAVAAALLLASGVCAMMSTADSALLAFSTMWVRDIFKQYLVRGASDRLQLAFGKLMAIIGLCIGVGLSLKVIKTGKPDLSGLFALQAVTPIHVAPAMWLGLHWRKLRGEAVLTGMVSGIAVTLGLLFSDKNISYSKGSDMLENGLSSAWIGFCVNAFVTITLGLALQFGPRLSRRQRSSEASKDSSETAVDSGANVDPRSLDIGPEHDRLVPAWLITLLILVLLFSVPFYWPGITSKEPNKWVGNISAWAFVSLLLSGVLAIIAAAAYIVLWQDYTPLPKNDLPTQQSELSVVDASAVKSVVKEDTDSSSQEDAK